LESRKKCDYEAALAVAAGSESTHAHRRTIRRSTPANTNADAEDDGDYRQVADPPGIGMRRRPHAGVISEAFAAWGWVAYCGLGPAIQRVIAIRSPVMADGRRLA